MHSHQMLVDMLVHLSISVITYVYGYIFIYRYCVGENTCVCGTYKKNVLAIELFQSIKNIY